MHSPPQEKGPLYSLAFEALIPRANPGPANCRGLSSPGTFPEPSQEPAPWQEALLFLRDVDRAPAANPGYEDLNRPFAIRTAVPG